MSVGGPLSNAVNDAVSALIDAGVTVVTSAGNAGGDACTQSPASARGAVAVGATNASDGRAVFSNTGPCVTLFAPGQHVLSAFYSATSASPGTVTRWMSGTSMACPAVSGAAALFDFSGLPLDRALRLFLDGFLLPGEAQKSKLAR
jgi:serine protease